MGLISWLITGALAGWIASLITGNNKRMGAFLNIVVGIIGGFIGGFVMNLVWDYEFTEFSLPALLVAIGGSVVLLLVVNLIRGASKKTSRR